MKKHLFLRAIAVLLVLVTLMCVFSYTAFAKTADYDYSRPLAPSITLSASDILEDVLGYTVSEEEKKYLSLYSDFAFSYASGIPTSYLTTVFDENASELSVTAYEYSYTANNGVSVVWRPTSVVFREQEVSFAFENGVYVADYSGVTLDDDNSVEVKYSADFSIKHESINTFLNLAYKDAPMLAEIIKTKEAEYNALKAQYDVDIVKYKEYLEALSEYESNMVIYREYLSAKRIYDEAYAEYQTYLSEVEDYNSSMLKYNEYLKELEKYNSDYAKYKAYLDFLDRYQSEIDAYEEYERKMALVKQHLSVIEAVKTEVTPLKRSIYAAIMGDTVTNVIANKDIITSELVKADGPVVDLAGSATEKLRVLMTDYFAISTESGRYAYYVAHHEDFCNNFSDLLRALDKLYLVKRVRGVLIAQEKQEKYLILLAQLYCIVNALSDTPELNYDKTAYFDSNYIIGKGYNDQKKPQAILGSIYITDNNNAEPIEGGYPSPVLKPEYTPVDEPKVPAVVKEPVLPEEVENPGNAPDFVDEPQKPENVWDPGLPPEAYVHPDGADEIIELFEKGGLYEREELKTDIVLSREISVSKKFYGATEVSVFYFDTDGTLLYRTEVESGTFADYGGAIPYKAEDDSATYTFQCWVDASGTEQDLSAVTSDLSLYPKFSKKLKEYDITWSVDGTETTQKVAWGEVPVYPAVPQKLSGDSTYYVFKRWDKEPSAVVGIATYTAIFEEIYYVPYANGKGAEISFENGIYTADCHLGGNGKLCISDLLTLAAGNAGIKIETVNGSVVFSYSETIAMKNAGVSSVKVSASQRGMSGYTYTVSLFDANGEAVNISPKTSITVPAVLGDPSHMSLYYMDGSSRIAIRYSENNGEISFTAHANRSYYATLEYGISIIPSELVSISVSANTATPGEKIKIYPTVPDGITLKSVYYLDDGGNKVKINAGDVSMPMYDLRIGCDAVRNEYTVKFVSDGKVISSRVYHYGDTVEIPENPKKSSDEEYDYEFLGWSSEIKTVTEDAVYTAEYSENPIPPKPDDSKIKVTPSVMRILLLAGSLTVIFAVGFLPSLVLGLVLLIRHKMLKKRSKISHGT